MYIVPMPAIDNFWFLMIVILYLNIDSNLMFFLDQWISRAGHQSYSSTHCRER